MAEKEYQEYLNSLGLEFVNLTVESASAKDGILMIDEIEQMNKVLLEEKIKFF